MNATFKSMSILGTYELTHPESLTESELKEILENRCIDFSNYKNLSRSELIELYKRVALPLPQRGSENTADSGTKEHEGTDSIEAHRNSNFLTCTAERDTSDQTKISVSFCTRQKSLENECKQTTNNTHLCNSNSIRKCNGIDKRSNDEKQDEEPLRKRQKITWP